MRHSCLSIAVLALMGTTACFAADPPTSTRPAGELYLSLAADVEQCLQKDVLDKWFPAAVDEQGGGFHENFSADWSRAPGETRSLVYQSRLTWTAAKAAERFPERAQLYLAMTRRGAAFLADRLWDKQRGGFYWSVDAAGRPTGQGETRKHTYGMAFGIYALAASYRATRDPATQDLARQAFEWLERHVHDDVNKGYFESVTLDGKPHFGRNPIAGENQKSMNTSIHVLEALTELYKAWTDPAVRARIQEMYDICADRIYTEPGYLTMFFTPDWQRMAGEDSFGHDVETAYLLVEASELLGQSQHTRAWGLARNLVDHALRYGWDEQRGGLYDAAHIDAQGVVRGGLRTDKIWWVQAEHLNALLMLHDRFGNETTRYWDAFVKQWDFIRKHQIDHINGGWHPTVRADGTPVGGPKSGPWTECYHQGRALLNVSDRLRRLAETGPGAPDRAPAAAVDQYASRGAVSAQASGATGRLDRRASPGDAQRLPGGQGAVEVPLQHLRQIHADGAAQLPEHPAGSTPKSRPGRWARRRRCMARTGALAPRGTQDSIHARPPDRAGADSPAPQGLDHRDLLARGPADRG
jgi:mannobiose 2-epimerase